MIVQFFRYGDGQSKGPLDYLLGKDRQREHARILSGNESEISGLIDSSPFAKKYTSGCLSFYEDDLTPDAKNKIMSDFEKCLFPGFSQDQYRVLWIEHKDKINEETNERRLELNFLIPNVEITTGKRLQPFFHKADLSRVDLFKKITNFQFDLHDPNDPLNQQAVITKKSLPKSTAELKAVIDVEAEKAIQIGLVHDRESLKKWLLDLGLEITRETKKSISIKNPNDDEKARPIRLTGAIYEQDFRLTETSAERTREASQRYRREAEQRNIGDIERYRAHIDKKSAELREQYILSSTEHYADADRNNNNNYRADQQRSREHYRDAERSYSRDQAADQQRSAEHNAESEQINSRDQAADQQRPAEHYAESEQSTGRTKSKLSEVPRLEQRNSKSNQTEKVTFHIEYSADFSSLYRSYQQHGSDVREQEQIQRYTSDGDKNRVSEISGSQFEYSKMRNREKLAMVRSDRPESSKIFEQHDGSTGNKLNESRGSIVRDYREATAAIRERITTFRSASEDNRAARDIQQQIIAIHKAIEREKHRASSTDQEATKSRDFTRFITEFRDKFTAALRKSFDEIGERFKYRERSEQLNKRDITESSAERNKESDKALSFRDVTGEKQNEDNSRKLVRIDPDNIFKALDELDRRRELQREQTRKNDRGYDHGF